MLQVNGPVSPEGVRCIESLLADRVLASARYVYTVDSTNSAALAELGQQESVECRLPRLYFTDMQTAGRGRLGRNWASGGDSLTFSVTMKIPAADESNSDESSHMPPSLFAGVAAAEAIDALVLPRETQLKWPNDIYIDGQKVGGILVEASGKRPGIAVVGIGINVHTAPAIELPTSTTATSIAAHRQSAIDRFDVLDEVLRRLLGPGADVAVAERFRQKCYLTGQRVSLDQAGVPRQGICHGIDDRGRLIVDCDGKLHVVQSGEATIVRRR